MPLTRALPCVRDSNFPDLTIVMTMAISHACWILMLNVLYTTDQHFQGNAELGCQCMLIDCKTGSRR